MSCDIGLWGLAIMGQNFALNMAEHGFSVAVGNRSQAKVEGTVARAKAEGDLPITGSKDHKDFCSKLSKPRKIIILVQAGKPVDDTIAQLTEHLEEGDVIVDGGNEWFPNTIRRGKELEKKGIMFVGMGISGGEEGARNGPSLMPGGPKKAYDLLENILTTCAAQVEGEACTGYLGPVGSGNYVKMVHNGIEYGDMQLIAEVYDVLSKVVGMSNEEMAKLFEEWNKTELESFLIEITYKILAKKDDITGKGEVLDYVLDKTGMKGTGRWTVQEAAEQSVAAPTIAASLDARYVSGRKSERVAASKVLEGPTEQPAVDKEQVIEDLKAALYCSKICSYAQGMGIIKAASDKYDWDVDLSSCARMWRGGCIIRAQLLGKIQHALAMDKDLPNLMVDPTFASEINARQMAWRRIVTLSVASGIACPALSASLTYYDQYRRERLPANMVQAQRDFFGGHTYERTDKEGTFHTAWTDAHKDIGDLDGRTAGNV
jgi:6-phosphogluconate dehydrogenase